jgi:hypothetical protein
MPVLPPFVFRMLRGLALVMMAVAAAFGIPIIIDPPPRDRAADVQDKDGRGSRPRRGRRRG